jgi:CDP-diglyceride synthetase
LLRPYTSTKALHTFLSHSKLLNCQNISHTKHPLINQNTLLNNTVTFLSYWPSTYILVPLLYIGLKYEWIPLVSISMCELRLVWKLHFEFTMNWKGNNTNLLLLRSMIFVIVVWWIIIIFARWEWDGHTCNYNSKQRRLVAYSADRSNFVAAANANVATIQVPARLHIILGYLTCDFRSIFTSQRRVCPCCFGLFNPTGIQCCRFVHALVKDGRHERFMSDK